MKKKVYLIMLLLFALSFFSIVTIITRKSTIISIEKETIKKIDGISEENADCNGKVWALLIPSLNVKAPIKEGVGADILKYSVGHFEETSLWKRQCSTCLT